MDDSPATLEPRRRRWKRWAVVGSLAILVGYGWWCQSLPARAIAASRQVRIGQTYAEVVAVMGEPSWLLIGDPYRLIDVNDLDLPNEAYFGRSVPGWIGRVLDYAAHDPHRDFGDCPVQIHFDGNGRVRKIRRGSEIIER